MRHSRVTPDTTPCAFTRCDEVSAEVPKKWHVGMQMTALASGSSEAPRTCALISFFHCRCHDHDDRPAREQSGQRGHPGRHGTSQQASRPAAGGPLDQAGLGPGPDTRHRTRWVVIVLCTNRRGGAVLRDQCPCMHAYPRVPLWPGSQATGHAHLT
jgi:hypothetical protein